VSIDYTTALTSLFEARQQEVQAGISTPPHLVASFSGVLRVDRSLADLGVPVAPWEDPEALALRVGEVSLSLRRDRFTRAELRTLKDGHGRELVMQYGQLTITLRWARSAD